MVRLAPLAALVALSCVCSRPDKSGEEPGPPADESILKIAKDLTLEPAGTTADLAEVARSPHPFGSPRQTEILEWLERRAADVGVTTAREAFTATVPNPAAVDATGPVALTVEKSGVNLWAAGALKGDAGCVVALGSHYDTKVVPGTDYLGANDSGSSTVALLHLLRHLKSAGTSFKAVCDIVAVWFDGEEAVLFNWDDGERSHPAKIKDHLYGSRHAAGRLTDCEYAGKKVKCLPADLGGKPLIALVLLDMIGSEGVRLSRDSLSTARLLAMAEAAATALGTPALFAGAARPIQDDHLPFLQAGVQALDLIDFHHTEVWHAAGDDPGRVSVPAMEAVARVGLHVALTVAAAPDKHLP